MYETMDDEFLICPYCGAKEEVEFETFFGNEAETSEEHECVNCGKTFMAYRNVIFTYETDKIEEDNSGADNVILPTYDEFAEAIDGITDQAFRRGWMDCEQWMRNRSKKK